MLRTLLATFLIFSGFSLSAQEPAKSQLAPCGAPPGIDPWLLRYSQRPQDYVSPRSDDTLNVGLQIHLLTKDNGTGRIGYERFLDAFCRLNADFEASGIRFYMKNPWNIINNTAWYDHNDIPQGIDMMLANNQPDVLNSYFVSDPAGNCGYNLPYAGVAIGHACAGANSHTWAHEVGHALSLPHPFIGWEGKVYNFANQTPDTLTYDYTYFHDSLETQVPAPLDTALVEYLDGNNCPVAADLFCDSKPDYLSQRWDCDTQGNSLQKQKDPDGAEFYSDGTLFMSYASDECQNRFSPDQIAAARANLLSEKIAWLSPGPPQPAVTGTAALIAPIADAMTPSTVVTLQWAAVPHATHYLVIGSRLPNYQVRDIEILTTDTTGITATLLPNKKYYWHVRAFNNWSACAPFTASETFVTAPVSAVSALGTEGWRIYPSVVTPGQPLWLEAAADAGALQCRVFDAAGRMLWNANLPAGGVLRPVEWPSGQWQPGVYQVVISGAKGMKSQRIVLLK